MLDQGRRLTDLTAGVVETLEVNEARLRDTLEAGFTQATDLADELMRHCGLDYRRAYQVVGQAVRALAEDGKSARQLTSDVLDAAAREVIGRSLALDPGVLAAVLDPAAIVATRVATGGAAPHRGGRDGRGHRAPAAAGGPGGRRSPGPVRGCRGRAAGQRPCVGRPARRARSRRRRRVTDARHRRHPHAARDAAVVNVGFSLFAEAVAAQGRPVATVDWRIPAGGDPSWWPRWPGSTGDVSRSIDSANAEVLRRTRPGRTTPRRRAPGEVRSSPVSTTGCSSTAVRPSTMPTPVTPSGVPCGPRWWQRAGRRASTTPTACSAGVRSRSMPPTRTTPWSRWSPRWALPSRSGWPTTPWGRTSAFAPLNQGPGETAVVRPGDGCRHRAPALPRHCRRRRSSPPRWRAHGPIDVLSLAAPGRPDGRRRPHPGPGQHQLVPPDPAAPSRRLRARSADRGRALPVLQPPLLPDGGHGRSASADRVGGAGRRTPRS